jgi:hypothetical protein
MTIGRNDPCPCGSGKKYKKCCANTQPAAAEPSSPGKFRFEPGSYGGPGGAYVPSILCQKRVSEVEWRDHFVLANPKAQHDDHDSAVGQAETDLAEAFATKQNGGTDADLAMSLKNKGYMSITGFRIIGKKGGGQNKSMEAIGANRSEASCSPLGLLSSRNPRFSNIASTNDLVGVIVKFGRRPKFPEKTRSSS